MLRLKTSSRLALALLFATSAFPDQSNAKPYPATATCQWTSRSNGNDKETLTVVDAVSPKDGKIYSVWLKNRNGVTSCKRNFWSGGGDRLANKHHWFYDNCFYALAIVDVPEELCF